MASLAKERRNLYRIHWKFKVRVGPRAGETLEGSLQLGRCTRAAAKSKLREIDEWEERVKTGRYVPDRDYATIRKTWLGDRALSCLQTILSR